MLDGFQYVFVQIGFVVAVTALLAGVLGWLICRVSGRRRAAKAAAPSALARPAVIEEPAPDTEDAEVAPTHATSEPAVIEEPAPDTEDAEVAPTHATPDAASEPLTGYVPMHAIEDPDPNEDAWRNDDPGRTVIRMTPTSGRPGTTPFLPRSAVAMYSAPVANTAPPVAAASARVVTVDEVQFLRQELRLRDLEIGRIEAAALSAWDRTVPQLEQQIEDLVAESHVLRRGLREARERSDADVLSIDHLRTLVAGRDTKIAELRAQS